LSIVGIGSRVQGSEFRVVNIRGKIFMVSSGKVWIARKISNSKTSEP
jgi:hypothetical protein